MYNMQRFNKGEIFMQKMIVIDLDGTLLNSEGQISKENKEAVRKAKEKGAMVIIASGRMPRAIKTYAKELGADKYIICGNGAIIYDIEKDEEIYRNLMSKEKTLEIINYCNKNSIYYSVYTETAIICSSIKHSVLVYNSENANKEDNKKTYISVVDDIYKYIDKVNTQNIFKINISDNNKIIFDRTVKGIREIPNIEVLETPDIVKRKIKLRFRKKRIRILLY